MPATPSRPDGTIRRNRGAAKPRAPIDDAGEAVMAAIQHLIRCGAAHLETSEAGEILRLDTGETFLLGAATLTRLS